MKQYKDTHYSIDANGNLFNNKTSRYLKPELRRNGYYYYKMLINGSYKNVTAHKLVFETYIGERDKTLDINHIDGNKKNNHYSNLEQLTRSENNKHAYRIGLRKPNNKPKLIKGKTRNYDKIILAIELIKSQINCKDFISLTNFSQTHYYRLKKQHLYAK
jgi:hypothetical protein